jgi:hypothetical protein
MWQLTPADLPELPAPGLPWWGIAGIITLPVLILLSVFSGPVQADTAGTYVLSRGRHRMFRVAVCLMVAAALSILSSFIVWGIANSNSGEISARVQEWIAEDYGLEAGEFEARAIVPDERSVRRPSFFRDEVDGELVSIYMKLDPDTGEYYLETRDGNVIPPLSERS